MRVKEFTALEKSGCMFRLVDASKQGYMTTNISFYEANRIAIDEYYGDWIVIGFEPRNSKTITLYVKKEVIDESNSSNRFA